MDLVLIIITQNLIFCVHTAQCSTLSTNASEEPTAPFRDGDNIFLRNTRNWATYMNRRCWNAQGNNLDELVLSV
jgi:hypothetical protein